MAFKATGTAVKIAAIKFKVSVCFFIKAIHVIQFGRCMNLYFTAIADVADSPHSPELEILKIQPFKGYFTLINVVTSPRQ